MFLSPSLSLSSGQSWKTREIEKKASYKLQVPSFKRAETQNL
jgi:hypothetical protein